MKFDSYSRFLKSDVYKECLERDARGEDLQFGSEESLDPNLRISIVQPSASESSSNNNVSSKSGNPLQAAASPRTSSVTKTYSLDPSNKVIANSNITGDESISGTLEFRKTSLPTEVSRKFSHASDSSVKSYPLNFSLSENRSLFSAEKGNSGPAASRKSYQRFSVSSWEMDSSAPSSCQSFSSPISVRKPSSASNFSSANQSRKSSKSKKHSTNSSACSASYRSFSSKIELDVSDQIPLAASITSKASDDVGNNLHNQNPSKLLVLPSERHILTRIKSEEVTDFSPEISVDHRPPQKEHHETVTSGSILTIALHPYSTPGPMSASHENQPNILQTMGSGSKSSPTLNNAEVVTAIDNPIYFSLTNILPSRTGDAENRQLADCSFNIPNNYVNQSNQSSKLRKRKFGYRCSNTEFRYNDSPPSEKVTSDSLTQNDLDISNIPTPGMADAQSYKFKPCITLNGDVSINQGSKSLNENLIKSEPAENLPSISDNSVPDIFINDTDDGEKSLHPIRRNRTNTFTFRGRGDLKKGEINVEDFKRFLDTTLDGIGERSLSESSLCPPGNIENSPNSASPWLDFERQPSSTTPQKNYSRRKYDSLGLTIADEFQSLKLENSNKAKNVALSVSVESLSQKHNSRQGSDALSINSDNFHRRESMFQSLFKSMRSPKQNGSHSGSLRVKSRRPLSIDAHHKLWFSPLTRRKKISTSILPVLNTEQNIEPPTSEKKICPYLSTHNREQNKFTESFVKHL